MLKLEGISQSGETDKLSKKIEQFDVKIYSTEHDSEIVRFWVRK